MANAKAAKPPVKTGKPAGTALVSWEDRMAKYAKETTETEKPPAGSFISVRAGQMQYANQPVAGNKLDVVIAGFVFENAFYTDDFDPDDPKSPVCFAFGDQEDGMKPHPDSMEPQCASCAECEHNEWGSAPKGKGKACKNIRRLGLLSAKPLTAEAMLKGDLAILKMPVTSVRGWQAYAHQVAAVHNRPPFAVVTQISTAPDPKTQFKVLFEHLTNIGDEEVFAALEQRRASGMKELYVPYMPNEDKPARPARGKAAAKKPGVKSKY